MTATTGFTGGSDLFDRVQISAFDTGAYSRFRNLMALTNYLISLNFGGIHSTYSGAKILLRIVFNLIYIPKFVKFLPSCCQNKIEMSGFCHHVEII